MDPRNTEDIIIGMSVKVSIGKNDPREKWILTTVKEVLSVEKYCPHGVEIIIHDNRTGYCKEFVESFTQISELELEQLIENHETINFELKSSFQWSVKNNRKAECLGEQVVREIAAFMNSKGGVICIGVDNSRNVLGLKNDFSISNPKVGQPIEEALVSKIRSFVTDRLHCPTTETLFNTYVFHYKKKQVCIIQVKQSDNPIFILEKYDSRSCDSENEVKIKKWPFYVRTDQGTREYSPYEAKEYWAREKGTNFL